MGFFDIIRANPDVAVAACKRQIADTRAEIAAGRERLQALAREREELISDIDNAGYLKQVAAVDKKIEAETANVDACVSRIQILRQRLRSAEIAVLEARKADFIARIQKLLPRRQQSARKIKLGLELVARGRLELRTTEAELFSGPGWLSTEPALSPNYFRATLAEFREFETSKIARPDFDVVAAIEKLNAGLIDILQRGKLPSPPSDDDDDEVELLSPPQDENSEEEELEENLA